MKKSLLRNKDTGIYNQNALKLSKEIEKAITPIIRKYKKNYFLSEIELIVSQCVVMPIFKMQLGIGQEKKSKK